MRIPLTCLEVSDTTFHDIVPGKGIYPLGKINLDVIFGTPQNFRRERIDLEVVEWPSQYHCILGRVTFARFMVVPHYAYLQMKMPGPNRIITVSESFERSDSYDREFSRISQSFGMQEKLVRLKESTYNSLPPLSKPSSPEQSFDTSIHTKAVQVHPTDVIRRELRSKFKPRRTKIG